jgi:hypothetical protein
MPERNCDRDAHQDRQRTIPRREYAGRVEQFVARDLGEKHGGVRGEEEGDHGLV